jgi:hypothetical protein
MEVHEIFFCEHRFSGSVTGFGDARVEEYGAPCPFQLAGCLGLDGEKFVLGIHGWYLSVFVVGLRIDGFHPALFQNAKFVSDIKDKL